MKTFLWALVAVALLCPASLSAAIDDQAELRDIQRLQQELENLDDDLQTLDGLPASTSRELRDRADGIRDEATYLKVKIERNQRRGEAGTGVAMSEIEALSREVRELRNDIDSYSARAARPDSNAIARGRELRIPEGTEISVRLEESLSSATARDEDRFKATLQQPVRVDGAVAIPAGAEVRGIVRSAEAADRLRRSGRLTLDFDTVYVDGTRLDLRTRIVSLQDEVGSKETARKAGIGAIIGGVVGGLLKGRTGALVGVLAGGGVVMAQRGEDVEIPEGTILRVRLDRAVAVSREVASRAD
jgi:hypothetical protein